MHRIIQDHLQLLLVGASDAEAALLKALLRAQPQIELIVDGTQPPGLRPDAVLRCADRRDTTPPASPPCLWLLRQSPSQPAVDELPLSSLGATRLLRLLALLIDQQRAADRLAQLAQRDPLTGLATPLHLHEQIARRLQRARSRGEQVALLHITLDPLPELETLERDDLLAQLGAAIADDIDERQLAVRLADSEFLVVTAGFERQAELAELARDLLQRCRLRGERWLRAWQVSVSIGIALAPADGEDATALLADARTAAHQCRDRGGDNFAFVDPERDLLAHQLAELQGELGHALLRNEIALRYQPQFDIRRRGIVALEVLLRWQHPRLGLLSPRYFLDLARSSGAIHPLGSWVVRKACEQRRQWLADGTAPLALTFNVDRHQLQHGTLHGCLQQLIDDGELTHGAIGIEIGEAELAGCDRAQIAQLQALGEHGVQLTIDNFSGDHCTVAQLQRLPLRALKFERRLTAGDDTAFERALRLCRALRCDAIAAGVEQRRGAGWLRRRDCDAIQGFVVSRPLTAEELPRWLRQVDAKS